MLLRRSFKPISIPNDEISARHNREIHWLSVQCKQLEEEMYTSASRKVCATVFAAPLFLICNLSYAQSQSSSAGYHSWEEGIDTLVSAEMATRGYVFDPIATGSIIQQSSYLANHHPWDEGISSHAPVELATRRQIFDPIATGSIPSRNPSPIDGHPWDEGKSSIIHTLRD